MQYEGSCHCGQIAFVVEAAEPITDPYGNVSAHPGDSRSCKDNYT